MKLHTLRGKKMLTLVALLLVVVLAFALTGCGNNSDNNGEEKVELTMGHPFSSEHPVSQEILIPLAQELLEESNGRIQLTIHPAGAITSASSVYEDVIAGSFDIGWTLQGYTPGRYPLTEVVELPFIFDSAVEGSKVFWKLYEEHSGLQEEYNEVKVLGFWVTDPGDILSKTLVESPEDMVGQRVRFAGPMQEAMLDAFGAVPVGMAAPEMYDSLERGIIDGIMIGHSTIESYRLHEVINNVTSNLQLFVSPQTVFMNSETWDSLSTEDQELIARLTGERMALQGGEIYDEGYQTGLEMAIDAGVDVYEAPAAVRQQWQEKTAFLVDEWIASMEANGHPGQELYDLMMSFIEEERN